MKTMRERILQSHDGKRYLLRGDKRYLLAEQILETLIAPTRESIRRDNMTALTRREIYLYDSTRNAFAKRDEK